MILHYTNHLISIVRVLKIICIFCYKIIIYCYIICIIMLIGSFTKNVDILEHIFFKQYCIDQIKE